MLSGCFSYSYQIGAILKLDCEFQILSGDTKMIKFSYKITEFKRNSSTAFSTFAPV